MFGISLSEIIFILIIALIVLGPKQLANIISKVWLSIISIRRHLDDIKNDLYTKSGISDIKKFHQETLNDYNNLKNSILKNIPLDSHLTINEEIFYQPELDFEREPELFDEIY